VKDCISITKDIDIGVTPEAVRKDGGADKKRSQEHVRARKVFSFQFSGLFIIRSFFTARRFSISTQ
jgi:hypothetical protein